MAERSVMLEIFLEINKDLQDHNLWSGLTYLETDEGQLLNEVLGVKLKVILRGRPLSVCLKSRTI